MSDITTEKNFPRKSHRVDFPFFVEIDGHAYRAKDWSLTGVGLIDLNFVPTPGQRVEARAVLPMVDSVLTLNVALVFRTHHGENVAGFEFADLSARNRRVLRHYIELAVEGRIENLEDLVSVATTPGIRSPLEDALNLTELESEGLLKNFKQKSRAVLVLSVLFVVALVAMLFYNTTYRIHALGFVAGNLNQVTANRAGIVTALSTREKAYVAAGAPLFVIEDRAARERILAIDLRLRGLAELPPRLAAVAAAPVPNDAALLASLREQHDARRREFDNATRLHEQRIIDNKNLATARNHFLQARTDLLREEARIATRALVPPTQLDPALAREIADLKAERAALVAGLGDALVTAPEKGRIYQIAKTAGEFARADEAVLLLERDVKPYVLVGLMTEDAVKLRIGMAAEIYVPFEDISLAGKVTAIGHAAVNADMTESLEGSLKETLVKVEFDDAHVRLPPNARVKVWIRTWNSSEAT